MLFIVFWGFSHEFWGFSREFWGFSREFRVFHASLGVFQIVIGFFRRVVWGCFKWFWGFSNELWGFSNEFWVFQTSFGFFSLEFLGCLKWFSGFVLTTWGGHHAGKTLIWLMCAVSVPISRKPPHSTRESSSARENRGVGCALRIARNVLLGLFRRSFRCFDGFFTLTCVCTACVARHVLLVAETVWFGCV